MLPPKKNTESVFLNGFDFVIDLLSMFVILFPDLCVKIKEPINF